MDKNYFNGWKVVKFFTGGLGQWACILGGLWFTIGAIADKNSFWAAAFCFIAYPFLFFMDILATLCVAGRNIEISELKKKENQ